MHAVLLNFLEKTDPEKFIAVSTNILSSFNMDTNKKSFSNELFSKWLGNIEQFSLAITRIKNIFKCIKIENSNFKW